MKRAALLLMATAATGVEASTIKVNQLGFLPQSNKLAVVADARGADFEVREAASGKTVLKGKLSAAASWKPARQSVRVADFSALSKPGRYRIKISDGALSDPFEIGPDVYRALGGAAVKAFYFNRAGSALLAQHAGAHARAAGHPDDKVLVHASAASEKRPEGSIISSPKGWYDAGDYNKYVVNSGIATYTLLAAYEHFPAHFAKLELGIPESGDALPDILDEALWNLEWMLTMQDPQDGGVYNKLTNKKFDAMVMPADAMTAPRYVVAKGTAAALDFAATMAVASRVFKPFEQQRPGLSQRMLAAAQAAWRWAEAHPDLPYKNPPDIVTGEYGDKELGDEWQWAAAELLISTGDKQYRRKLDLQAPVTVPTWSDVRGLGAVSLAQHRARLPAPEQALAAKRITQLADALARQWEESAYRVAMQEPDFVWGSNAVVMNQAMMLVQAYRIEPRRDYLDAAQSALDYVMGRNATDYAFVTGFGARPALHPHHRPSQADRVMAPVPGFLVGGPQAGQQDQAECPLPYPTKVAAISYLDHVCSYASNEVAINWNAPLVYVAAALQVLTPSNAPTPTTMTSQETTLDAIVRQEQALQFDAFDHDTALQLGLRIIALAREAKQSVAVDITRNGNTLFYHGMEGTTPDHVDWIRRKNNLVNRTGHSSFYTHTKVKQQGGDYDAIPTLDIRQFAAHGGAFPLTIRGTGPVGTITVSGLPGPEDHALVVRALKAQLAIAGDL